MIKEIKSDQLIKIDVMLNINRPLRRIRHDVVYAHVGALALVDRPIHGL